MPEETAPASIDLTAIAAAVSFFVPLLISTITKKEASPKVKSAANILVTALVAVAALFINPANSEVNVAVAINTFVTSFVSSLVGYVGVWKPTGITDTVSNLTSKVGVGPKESPATREETQ